jgi:hypothetical protein
MVADVARASLCGSEGAPGPLLLGVKGSPILKAAVNRRINEASFDEDAPLVRLIEEELAAPAQRLERLLKEVGKSFLQLLPCGRIFQVEPLQANMRAVLETPASAPPVSGRHLVGNGFGRDQEHQLEKAAEHDLAMLEPLPKFPVISYSHRVVDIDVELGRRIGVDALIVIRGLSSCLKLLQVVHKLPRVRKARKPLEPSRVAQVAGSDQQVGVRLLVLNGRRLLWEPRLAQKILVQRVMLRP